MSDRLPSDHPSVDTVRVHLERVGRTGRRRVPVPDGLDVPVDEVVRLSIEGEAVHGHVEETLGGDPAIAGAFDNARLARTADEGTDRLGRWLDEHGLGPGDPVAIDVLTPGYAYGLRRPGERVVYRAPDPPSDSLADIARELDG